MELNNKRMLVIDDHAGLRYMFSIRLISAGYTVYGAANGLEGSEQMEKHSIDSLPGDVTLLHTQPARRGKSLVLHWHLFRSISYRNGASSKN